MLASSGWGFTFASTSTSIELILTESVLMTVGLTDGHSMPTSIPSRIYPESILLVYGQFCYSLSHQYNTLLYWYTNLLLDSDSIMAYAYYRSFCMPPSRLRRLYISASDYSASYILSLTSLWGEDKVIRYFFVRDKMKVSER